MDSGRLVGYRIVKFSSASETALREIALRLMPHQEEIIRTWIGRQWRAWQPPGLTREALGEVFGDMFRGLLRRMEAGELQAALQDLEDAGSRLAAQQFPFEALIISVHFLEESYLPLLLTPASPDSQGWLMAMDEFLHAALASIASSYFQAHRKSLLEEAEVGRIVQEGLLPDIPRTTLDLEVAHIYTSAHERARLGGDFLDFFVLDETRSAFIIGDLSGHGVEAAADSVMLRSLFRGFMRENPAPTIAMERMNRAVIADLRMDQFATALAVVYEAPGRLSLVSAGHPYPVLVCRGLPMLDPDGMALAVDRNATYSATEVELDPGAVFVAYTDGLTEAGERSTRFGEEGLVRELSSLSDAPARAIAEHLVDAALRFAGGRFSDDVAVLVLKRRVE